MLDRFLLKNKADCTSHCLKRSSGARVMTLSWVFLPGPMPVPRFNETMPCQGLEAKLRILANSIETGSKTWFS